jgi:phosphoribosylformylglycinamidine (FGAM) synthase PurS component
MTKKARIIITIKADVSDPAGVALKKVLDRQGVLGLKEVRIGKVVDIVFNDERIDLKNILTSPEIKNILQNPLIEECQVSMMDDQ